VAVTGDGGLKVGGSSALAVRWQWDGKRALGAHLLQGPPLATGNRVEYNTGREHKRAAQIVSL
jgi:hypothetical protein